MLSTSNFGMVTFWAQVILPGSLECLTLADSDLDPLDLSLPCGLKDLTLGGGFNQKLQSLQLPTALQRCRMVKLKHFFWVLLKLTENALRFNLLICVCVFFLRGHHEDDRFSRT